MSKAPTVSELVGDSNIIFKTATASCSSVDSPRPDFNTDVLWKPIRLSQKQRTISTDSSDSEGIMSSTERRLSSTPVDVPQPRRLSITEMIFGSTAGGFSWGQSNLQGSHLDERRASVTDDERFKELMKHQNKILGDDGICSFKKRDYMK
ncbi:hypothetical protein NECAME_16694 [Necator americanus]|nr:hypothetical protein NECAME_16694 [Necator americanus]ETN85696.1 hypothetical protein NECAME_16694 [Necator americanus]